MADREIDLGLWSSASPFLPHGVGYHLESTLPHATSRSGTPVPKYTAYTVRPAHCPQAIDLGDDSCPFFSKVLARAKAGKFETEASRSATLPASDSTLQTSSRSRPVSREGEECDPRANQWGASRGTQRGQQRKETARVDRWSESGRGKARRSGEANRLRLAGVCLWKLQRLVRATSGVSIVHRRI
jgi:hypothetical protein